MTYISPGVVVPAVPPRPPQITLLNSAIRPDTTSDPANPVWRLGDQQWAMLPDELQAELDAGKGDSWIRGFTYAPENRYVAQARDPCDYTTVDTPALNAPTGLAGTPSAVGGSLATGTYSYQVTAVNANGETTALPAITVMVTSAGSMGSVSLSWTPTADGAKYNVYGRVSGSIGKLGQVGPFDPDNLPSYVDTGTPAPGAAPPVSNTTGGPGAYGNLAIINYQPWLAVVEDSCSSWGWSERDFKGRALRLLDSATPAAIEAEFWAGILAQAKSYPNRYLMDSGVTNLTPGATTPTNGTPPTVDRGFEILQQALAACGFGGQGMIHCEPAASPNLLNVRRVGSLLLDIFDNIVVPGVGYQGTGPTGDVPATGYSWMGATDLVACRSEQKGRVYPDTFAEALDRGQAGQPNRITFRAERFVAASADFACQFAIKVQLPS
jgi:hypothetical protein